jgi:hypothetical protein
MKTIQALRILINILFYCLLIVLAVGFISLIILLFFNDLLPQILQQYKTLFSTMFNWKLLLIPTITVINYILFVVGVYYLRKVIPFFPSKDFYNLIVIKSLKKAGNLFIFIGASSILVRLISIFIMQNMTQSMVVEKSSIWLTITPLIASLDLVNIFLIIIGLFLLLFSKSFENAKELKQENDLTI